MPYILPQPVAAEAAPYVFHDKAFSDEECEKVIALSKKRKPHAALTGGSGPKPDPTKRVSSLYWLEWQQETDWLFAKLAPLVTSSNNRWFRFHLAGFNEALQLTHYHSVTKSHYGWHEDYGHEPAFQHRKLSVVVALNDGYEGGNFEFLHTGKVPEATKGSVIIFPSFLTHRVTPVSEGERWSLVAWVNGPPFV